MLNQNVIHITFVNECKTLCWKLQLFMKCLMWFIKIYILQVTLWRNSIMIETV